MLGADVRTYGHLVHGAVVLRGLFVMSSIALDQNGPLGRRGTNMLKVSVLDKRS